MAVVAVVVILVLVVAVALIAAFAAGVIVLSSSVLWKTWRELLGYRPRR